MNIQEKANYVKTIYVYALEQAKTDNPSATDAELRELARTELRTSISRRVSIGDGVQKSKTDGGGSPTGTFEIKIKSLVKGLRPFEIQGLNIAGTIWSVIDTRDGVPKEEIKEIIFESPDSFSAVRLYDPVSGVYSNVYKLK